MYSVRITGSQNNQELSIHTFFSKKKIETKRGKQMPVRIFGKFVLSTFSSLNRGKIRHCLVKVSVSEDLI